MSPPVPEPSSDLFAAIARRHGLALIVQFGSTVSGKVHERSDVDVGVLADGPALSYRALAEIAAELQELFGERKVDLASLNHADPLFLHLVVSGCRLLAGAPRRLHELRMLAFRRHQDHQRYLRMERDYVRRFLGHGRSMIDRELVTRKMTLIASDLVALRSFADRPLADYLASPTDELVVERYLERIIGRMIDLNYHVLTESGLAPPRDYYDSFVQLAGLQIFDHEFARRIAASAGLRNRIVHEYDEIDARRVHGALTVALADIPEYLRRLDAYVQRAAAP